MLCPLSEMVFAKSSTTTKTLKRLRLCPPLTSLMSLSLSATQAASGSSRGPRDGEEGPMPRGRGLPLPCLSYTRSRVTHAKRPLLSGPQPRGLWTAAPHGLLLSVRFPSTQLSARF